MSALLPKPTKGSKVVATKSEIFKTVVLKNNLKTNFEKNMLILYGSQSGKSKDFAQRLAKMAELTDVFVNCRCIADYQFEKFHTMKLVVVVTSTYGHGEPPQNAIQM